MRAILIREYEPGKCFAGKRVVALGFFDGVHLGHREILKRAVCEAKKRSLPSAVFTFYSESDGIKGEERIYSTKEKLSLISECGIDEVIISDFNAVRSLSAEDFIRKTLIEGLGASVALSGKDFRFGKGALGNTEMLACSLGALGAELICPEDVEIDGEKISSTRVKELLRSGSVKRAAELLGAPYFVKSTVKRGLGLGRGFGFPTVNIEMEKNAVSLPSGVYKCRAEAAGLSYKAITNVGSCPTVSDREKHIETYIIGYEGDLYGEKISVSFLDFIRPEKKFDSVEQLKMQINIDINTALGNEE